MKTSYFFIAIGLFLISISSIFAQERKMENITVIEFKAPFDMIKVMANENSRTFHITPKTTFRNRKNKRIESDLFKKGCTIDVTYSIKNKKRIAQEIKLISSIYNEMVSFEGAFEFLENDIAFIDGKKVKLGKDVEIDCSGKSGCGCIEGDVYMDFSEVNKGDFITIKGKKGSNGIIYANEALLFKNAYTQTDRKLRAAVENSYNTDGARIVQAPKGIIVPPNTLSQGNIQIGNMEYPLVQDIRLQGYVNMVGNRILPDYVKEESFKRKHHIFFRFYVIDNAIPNAFAFPNGMVFIHTGLLQLMENEAQLAAVLGHEIAHVTYEHASSRYKTQRLIDNKVTDKLKERFETGIKTLNIKLKMKKLNTSNENKGAEVATDMLSAVGNSLSKIKPSDISNLFEKSKETQADRVGLFYMYLAGYDPREAISFWQLMSEQIGDETFKDKLATNAFDLLNSNAIDLDKNSLANLSGEMTEKVVGSYLETIYTSHPLIQKRLEDIHQLLLTTYDREDFSEYMKGEEEYAAFVSFVK